MKNYLNFNTTEEDTPIYRVFSKTYFNDLIDNRRLCLVRPSLWADPFENYIMNSKGLLKDGTPFTVDFRTNLYGQCWTLKKESDAIWRIYAKDEDGIKVKTTIKKLYNALYQTQGQFKDISCFIGKVKYFKKTDLIEFLGDRSRIRNWLTDPTCRSQAHTLLFKRIPFSHEKEVRLIFYSPNKLVDDKYFVNIDLNELIDEITIDPRVPYNTFRTWKDELINKGIKKKIIRSNLYKSPSLTFKF